jgi:hypothetical protein
MYQQSATELGFSNHGTLLSVILLFSALRRMFAVYFRRAMRAAKSSCRRRMDGW